MQNPYIEALAQGGSVANQGLAQASNSLSHVADIFNSSASLAMKMNVLLEQEEARKQQELMQNTQLMQNIMQSRMQNDLAQRRIDLQRQQLEDNNKYRTELLNQGNKKIAIESELAKAKIKSLSIPKQPNVKDLEYEKAINYLNKNGITLHQNQQTGTYEAIDSNGNRVQLPLSVIAAIGYKPKDFGTIKTLSGQTSNLFKDIQPEDLPKIFDTAVKAYENGDEETYNMLYGVLSKANPRLASKLKDEVKTNTKSKLLLSDIVSNNIEDKDNELLRLGSNPFTYESSSDSYNSFLRKYPESTYVSSILNDLTDQNSFKRLMNDYFGFFNKDKKVVLSNYINYNLGEATWDLDKMAKDGIIGKDTYRLMEAMQNNVTKGMFPHQANDEVNRIKIQNEKYNELIKNGIPKKEALKRAYEFSEKYINGTLNYYKNKQKLINSLKKDGLYDAYKKVSDVTKNITKTYIDSGLSPEEALQQAKKDIFSGRAGIDQKDIIKASLYLYAIHKAYVENGYK